MPPASSCVLSWPLLPEPPAALQMLVTQLRSTSTGAAAGGDASSPTHSPHAWLRDSLHRALLEPLVAFMSAPFPVTCASCSQRGQRKARGSPEGDAEDDRLASDHGEGSENDSARCFLGLHSRTRLTLESPLLQLNFLRLMQCALEEDLTPSPPKPRISAVKSEHDDASSWMSDGSPSLVSLLRAYASEVDWRVDEEELLRRCQLQPPAASNTPAARVETLFHSADGDTSADGLYVPAPPQLVASRAYYHLPEILASLRALVRLLPSLAPLSLPHKQERYFKNQQLAVTSTTDAYAQLVQQLRAHSLHATFAPAAAARSDDGAADSAAVLGESNPLASFVGTSSPWLRFESTAEEEAMSAAELQAAEDRRARRKRRREVREERALERAGKIEEDEERMDVDVAGQNEDLASERKAADIDEDDDIILLSQAPRAAAASAAAASAHVSPAKFARPAAVVAPTRRRGSMSSGSASSSAPSSALSSPSRRSEQGDALEAAALQLGLAAAGGGWWLDSDAATAFPLFDEPEEEGGAAESMELTQQSQPHKAVSLDEAFAAASQQAQATETVSAAEAKEQASGAPQTRASPSPPPAAAGAAFSSTASLYEQLDTLHFLLTTKLSSAKVCEAVASVVLDVLARAQPQQQRAGASALPRAPVTPQVLLDAMLAQPRFDDSSLRQVFAITRAWRELPLSAKEFDTSCTRVDFASWNLGATLLFLAAFLHAEAVSAARVRRVLSLAVLPLLRREAESLGGVRAAESANTIMQLLQHAHEEPLVDSVLAPFLAHAVATSASQHVSFMMQLLRDVNRASSNAVRRPLELSTQSRLLLLQSFCVASIQHHEQSSSRTLPWIDASGGGGGALALLQRLLEGVEGALPAPQVEHHAALAAMAADASNMSSGSSSLLAKLLPAGAASAASTSPLSLCDVSSLLLACFALAGASPALRPDVSLRRVLLLYLNTHAAAHGFSRSPQLQLWAQHVAKAFGGPVAATIKRVVRQ